MEPSVNISADEIKKIMKAEISLFKKGIDNELNNRKNKTQSDSKESLISNRVLINTTVLNRVYDLLFEDFGVEEEDIMAALKSIVVFREIN